MRTLSILFAWLTSLCLLLTAPLSAQEWTRFHGPNGTGASEAKSIPSEWTEADYNWKLALPGIGNSSPVLWGDRVFLLSADAKNATRYVVCVSATRGKVLWQRKFTSESHHLHQLSSYASCTPAVDDERVYVAWSTPKVTTLLALTHDGETAWEKDLGPWVSSHGFGTSPMLYEDLVIVNNSQQAQQLDPGQKPGDSFIMAFDKRTGDARWSTPRISTRVSYSVPCVYQPAGGKPELICANTGNGMFSLDPKTGKENWSIKTFTMRTVASPLVVGDLILGSTGSGGGGNYVVAVRPGTKPELAYEIKKSAPYVPTCVAHDDLAFLWYDGGIVNCIDVATGKVHYSKRVGGKFYGSPIRVADKIYCISEEGDVVVIAASKEFEILARNQLGEPSRSTPAVAKGRMYLRTFSHLISIGAESL